MIVSDQRLAPYTLSAQLLPCTGLFLQTLGAKLFIYDKNQYLGNCMSLSATGVPNSSFILMDVHRPLQMSQHGPFQIGCVRRPARAVAQDLMCDTPVGPGAQTHLPSSYLSAHVQPAGWILTQCVLARACLPVRL